LVQGTVCKILGQEDRDEIAALLKRGEAFITSGDLASARLVLQRAAEAGDVHAALTLAATFDPNLLAKLGPELPADVVKARFWYERAKQLGSTEAPRRLEQLASQVNSVP
jgi:TPR repeat protein